MNPDIAMLAARRKRQKPCPVSGFQNTEQGFVNSCCVPFRTAWRLMPPALLPELRFPSALTDNR